jgi:hypothetical protein
VSRVSDIFGTRRRLLAFAGAALCALLWAGAAQAAPPPEPCSPGLVINDAVDDGHHKPTDITAAWLTEANGKLQAVIVVNAPAPRHEHDNQPGAALAFLFTVNGVDHYVKAYVAVEPEPNPTVSGEYGTYTVGANTMTFTATAATVAHREVVPGGRGWVLIDVPEAIADTGDLLRNTFAVTYDGEGEWVDHAPGGEKPWDPARGPSFLVGKCIGVEIEAPGKRTGPGKVTVSGRVLQPESLDGDLVTVTITRTVFGKVLPPLEVDVDEDGEYSKTFTVKETTRVKAEADLDVEGVPETFVSQELTITMRSTAKIKKAKRKASGVVVVKGVTKPKLPGRLLLLNTNKVKASATKKAFKGGKFTFKKKLKPGRYLVVYVPKNNRAVRSVSKAVRVR